MDAIASQITSFTIVYSNVYSGADQRKHQSSTSLAFVRGIHRRPVNSPHKWPVTRKRFPFDHVIMSKLLVLTHIIIIFLTHQRVKLQPYFCFMTDPIIPLLLFPTFATGITYFYYGGYYHYAQMVLWSFILFTDWHLKIVVFRLVSLDNCHDVLNPGDLSLDIMQSHDKYHTLVDVATLGASVTVQHDA